ncbi:caspase family protein [Ruminococcus sp.]|uniref:caspase family protein n=1 Tax=Ruminococcus sp. TaxID=41978 RepID=UPI0025F290FE|nr:caspase family protein [Ruminococcus sp.]MBR1429947.1 caspase family protein [Ruminococcus sp.]
MIKSFVVGVSEYDNPRYNIPLCYNDIQAIKEAMELGLSVKQENIYSIGEKRTVKLEEFKTLFCKVLKKIEESDTFIFYFSGHGSNEKNENYIIFSNAKVSVKELISVIDSIPCKNKIVILDCCHSGNEGVLLSSPIDINDTVDQFVNHGCAIMASCRFNEKSGFDYEKNLSLYTRILYDALTARSLIKQGKKSLEDIKEYVDRLAYIDNKKLEDKYKQHCTFRSSIVGTIYFDVEEYTPYTSKKIYKETDQYIIYSVEPMGGNVKRIALKVILRFPCEKKDIAVLATEINKEAINYDVFSSLNSEKRWKGKPNNIIFAYYGYDEEDVINGTYAFRSTWVDENQDKGNWYRETARSSVIDDIWIEESQCYFSIKKYINDNTSDDTLLIETYRTCIYKMIIDAEKYLSTYSDYANGTISEVDFIYQVKGLTVEIRKLFLEQTDFSIASKELHNWALAYSALANAIDEFVVVYNEQVKRNSDDRKILMNIAKKNYNECLEKVKVLDIELSKKLDS